jgi:hypothetical protein
MTIHDISVGFVFSSFAVCNFGKTKKQVSKTDLFPNEQNFDLDKSRQKFHHSLKEHHKISNIPTFRCEML